MTTFTSTPTNPILPKQQVVIGQNTLPSFSMPMTMMGAQPGKSSLLSFLVKNQIGLNQTQKQFEKCPNFLNYFLKSELTMFDLNEGLVNAVRGDQSVMLWMDEVDDIRYKDIPVPQIKRKKTLSLEKFLEIRQKEIVKAYKKYLKNAFKQEDTGFNPLEHRLRIEAGLMRAKLPVNITQDYLNTYLNLDEKQTDLEKQFAVNKFFRNFKTHVDVEKYLNFIKKEYSDVESVEVDFEKDQLLHMKKIVLEGLNNEIQIIEKYYLKLKLSDKFVPKEKEKVKKI